MYNMYSIYKKKGKEEIVFRDANEAYDYINSWTNHFENYNTRFRDKKVKEVVIILNDSKPTIAFFHYDNKKYPGIGLDTIIFNDVLDKPKQKVLIKTKKGRKDIKFFLEA